MIGKNLEKHWKETYGFDFAAVAGDNSGVCKGTIVGYVRGQQWGM